MIAPPKRAQAEGSCDMHPADRRAIPTRPTPAVDHTSWLGPLDYWHRNEPVPLNPAYDPGAVARYTRVTASLERDGWYGRKTRAECAAEWRRRYDEDKAGRPV